MGTAVMRRAVGYRIPSGMRLSIEKGCLFCYVEDEFLVGLTLSSKKPEAPWRVIS